MNKAMMSHDWKENYTALLAEVRQLPNATDREGMRMHLENILDSFRPPDERDWCAMHVGGHCPCCGSHRCPGCGSAAGQILGHPIIENCITAMTSEFAACGCAIDFHKTCSCPKAESMNVVLCPLHTAAPSLLAVVKLIQWGSEELCCECGQFSADDHTDGCRVKAAIAKAERD